jgi:signal transduction histidine kinase
VIKHAGATRVELAVRHRPGEVEVEIVDDGRGLPRTGSSVGEADPASRDGQGLVGMRERVALFDGTLSTSSSRPGTANPGLRVRATFPVAVPVR